MKLLVKPLCCCYAGTFLALATRDGNNEVVVLAFVICLKEDGPNYKYMTKGCHKVDGLTPYLNRATQCCYSDRQKGIPFFGKEFDAVMANCIVHLIKNCRVWIRDQKKLGNIPGSARCDFPAKPIHDMQKEHTEEGFRKKLERFKKGFPYAGHYFETNPTHDKTYLYAILRRGVTTHLHNTSNVAEITMGLLK